MAAGNQRSSATRSKRIVIAVLMACLMAGCSAIGPATVPRDRSDYNTAIANSWKEQTLMNIVKIRYADMPLFVEVASVVAGYTLETQINAGASFPDRDTFGGDTLSVGASGRFTDRPTITYAPITGQQFNRSFMTPIPPRAVLFLMQSGWAVDLVFPITVDSMNGLRAPVATGTGRREGDQGYFRAITLLREIQKSGAVGMRIHQRGEEETTVMLFHKEGVPPEIQGNLEELETLLGIEPGAQEISVTYSQIPETDRELAMLTRSMMQIMLDMARLVEVPEAHALEGRTLPSMAFEGRTDDARTIRILSSPQKPEDALTAVKYRDHWFYIDDRDFASKRAFTFLMILFSLTETGEHESLPLVTIPAG